MRSPVRHARPVHRLRRAPPGAADRALRASMVRGADAAGGARRDGQGRRAMPHADRDRRAAHDKVRIRPRARNRRRFDPANEPRPGRRHSGGKEDRRHGGSALRADRAPSLLRAGRRRGQYSARDVQPEFPHSREHRALGRLPRRRSSRGRSAGRTATSSRRTSPALASSSTRRSPSPILGRGTTCTSCRDPRRSGRRSERPLGSGEGSGLA